MLITPPAANNTRAPLQTPPCRGASSLLPLTDGLFRTTAAAPSPIRAATLGRPDQGARMASVLRVGENLSQHPLVCCRTERWTRHDTRLTAPRRRGLAKETRRAKLRNEHEPRPRSAGGNPFAPTYSQVKAAHSFSRRARLCLSRCIASFRTRCEPPRRAGAPPRDMKCCSSAYTSAAPHPSS